MKKEVSAPLVIAAVVALLSFVGFLVYKGATGGVQGDGKVNNVEAAPPMPKGMEHGTSHVGSAP